MLGSLIVGQDASAAVVHAHDGALALHVEAERVYSARFLAHVDDVHLKRVQFVHNQLLIEETCMKSAYRSS